jgi:hypothetical protein
MYLIVNFSLCQQDPEAPRKGSLDRAIHAIAIVGKSTESDEIYLVAPLSNHWPDRTNKVPACEYVIGGTGEIHAGAPYKIRKDKIRIAHDGGQKTLKPGALEKLLSRMQENECSGAPLLQREQQQQQQPAQERHDGTQSQHCGGSQRGRRFGSRNYRGRNTTHYRIAAHPKNH